MKTIFFVSMLSSALALAADPAIVRGQKLGASPKVALADLLATPQANDGKTVTTEGSVRKNCERKGCWMELAPAASKDGPGLRVTFKDYGFFVPLDSAG